MTNRLRLGVRNRLEDLTRLLREADRFARAHRLGVPARRDLHVALDEIVSNIIRHGYSHDGPYDIRIHLAAGRDHLEVRITDDAPPFDPLSAAAPDLAAPLANRPVGGLGLELVRRLMDHVEYRRRRGRNELVLKKAVGRGGTSQPHG